MLVHARRARLLAYRVIATQQTGQVRPGDTAAYRIAVTRLDQESAEVLMDIAAELPRDDGEAGALPPGGRGPPPVLGVGHGGVRQHRDAADPAGPSPAGGVVNTDLSPEAVEYGATARRALEAAGGDELAPAGAGGGRRRDAPPRCSPTSAPGTSTPGAAPRSSRPPPPCAAAPAGGPCPTPSPSGWRARATSTPTPSSSWPATAPPSAVAHAVAGLALRWVAVDLDGRRSRATPRPDPAPAGKPGVTVPLDLAPLDDGAPATSPSGSSCRAGRCSASSTAPST